MSHKMDPRPIWVKSCKMQENDITGIEDIVYVIFTNLKSRKTPYTFHVFTSGNSEQNIENKIPDKALYYDTHFQV